jgi:hypothetical protein
MTVSLFKRSILTIAVKRSGFVPNVEKNFISMEKGSLMLLIHQWEVRPFCLSLVSLGEGVRNVGTYGNLSLITSLKIGK